MNIKISTQIFNFEASWNTLSSFLPFVFKQESSSRHDHNFMMKWFPLSPCPLQQAIQRKNVRGNWWFSPPLAQAGIILKQPLPGIYFIETLYDHTTWVLSLFNIAHVFIYITHTIEPSTFMPTLGHILANRRVRAIRHTYNRTALLGWCDCRRIPPEIRDEITTWRPPLSLSSGSNHDPDGPTMNLERDTHWDGMYKGVRRHLRHTLSYHL